MSGPDRTLIAVAPDSLPEMHAALVGAVEEAGARVVPIEEASALVFADPMAAAAFPDLIERGRQVEWVQLPYAGVETFAHHLDHQHVWTCGKGTYAPPVAEWIITALLTGFREIPRYVKASSWSTREGRNLLGSRLLVIGGGGVTKALLELLEPWGCHTTVVRRSDRPVAGASRTISTQGLADAVGDVDAVIVAVALTEETIGMVDASLLARMRPDAWLINVGRGKHVVTNDLVAALTESTIAGAVLDVTDPEPLPPDHALWSLDNCVITPHVGNTPEMGRPLIADRVRANVAHWIAGEPLIGLVDVDLGY